jgi:hypothetical protein
MEFDFLLILEFNATFQVCLRGFSTASTAPISDRAQTVQQAGAGDLFMHNLNSPAAVQFIYPGSLHGFVRRLFAVCLF